MHQIHFICVFFLCCVQVSFLFPFFSRLHRCLCAPLMVFSAPSWQTTFLVPPVLSPSVRWLSNIYCRIGGLILYNSLAPISLFLKTFSRFLVICFTFGMHGLLFQECFRNLVSHFLQYLQEKKLIIFLLQCFEFILLFSLLSNRAGRFRIEFYRFKVSLNPIGYYML